ncbi:MAG: hypothetical protein Q7S40_27460, partial [Opitutaceae bacterium]|nr:hypothetical protein [Opitutaceae bacterium]
MVLSRANTAAIAAMVRRTAAIVLLLAAPVRADVAVPVNTEPGSNITIKISSPVTSVPHFGFMPLRI